MTTFVFRLIPPRPTFALDMTDVEREIMGQHAAYCGPARDPAVTSGTAEPEIGQILDGFVRPR
ncbi:MAG: hypothetical protein ABWZ42_10450 [Ilumatobacteraceae bacterium]